MGTSGTSFTLYSRNRAAIISNFSNRQLDSCTHILCESVKVGCVWTPWTLTGLICTNNYVKITKTKQTFSCENRFKCFVCLRQQTWSSLILISFLTAVPWCNLQVHIFPTFSADAAQVCDLHQGFGEHVRFAGPTLPHVDLQSFQERFLKLVHLGRLLQVLTIWHTHTHIHAHLQIKSDSRRNNDESVS